MKKRVLLTLALLASACGPAREPSVPLGSYLESIEGTSPWSSFRPGGRVSVSAAETCTEKVSSGERLTPATWPHKSLRYTIADATVTAGSEASLRLLLIGDEGEADEVHIPAGTSPTCVTSAGSSEDGSLATLLQKPLRFRPSAPECIQLEASGSGLGTALFSNDPEPIVFSSLAVGYERARTTTGPTFPWAVAQGVDLRVRADLLATCFVPATDEATTEKSRFRLGGAPADGPELLHIDPRRCKRSTVTKGEHLECATAVGVWRGQRSSESVSLELKRRNVGTLHFIAGREVDAKEFARTIVSVRTASGGEDDRLYTGIRNVTEATLSADEGTRLASADETANLAIVIDVTDVKVSDKTTRSEIFVHEYEEGTRSEPNPEKARALRKVRIAEKGVETAKEECREKRIEAQRNYQTCIAAANAVADTANGKTERDIRTIGTVGCTAYKIIASGSCSEISEAQEELQRARATEADTPETVEVPIKKRANVTKTTYGRRVTAKVKMTTTLDGTEQPLLTNAFDAELTDHKIDPDARIKLKGHDATAPWLDDPKQAVPAVADKMAAWVSTRVREMLARARVERAKRTLAATGEEMAPGFEAIGGMAIELTDKRLVRMTNSGTFSLEAGRPVAVTRATKLAANECVLVVAIAPEGGKTAKLTIATVDGSVADVRGRRDGSIELCRADFPHAVAETPAIQVKSDQDLADVRWASFRTRATQEETTATNEVNAAPPTKKTESGAPSWPRPAPVEAFALYARASAATWVTGSVGSASLGDVFAPGLETAIGAGVRVGTGWLAYGEWDRLFSEAGTSSPLATFRDVSATNDTFLVGGRKTFTGWVIGSRGFRTFLSPLVDLAIGYSVLRQEGVDASGTSRVFRLPSPALRVMSGVSARPSRWVSLDPVVGASFGFVDDIEAEQGTSATNRHFEDRSIRTSLFAGIGGVIDVPFGDGGGK